MFKKNVTVSSTHQLSGKDGKELRRSVLKAFPSLSEEALSALLPGKSGLVQAKLSNRCVVYSLDGGNPLFFDPDGRGSSLLPTVYALAALPQLLPTLHTWSEVSGKVLGGADLFLQGVLSPQGGLPDFLAGSPRSLSVPGQPIPFAVGKMAVSRTEAMREGMKGRGWTLIHTFGDLLWQMGDKSPPNEGFTASRIFPLAQPEGQAGDDAAAAAAAAASGPEGGAGGDESGEAAVGQLAGLQLGGSGSGELGQGPAAAGGAAEEPAGGEGAAGAAAGPALDMDALLEAAVLAGLHSLKNADLPIQAGDFYTKHMLPARPEGVVFDMKQSKYKKLSKLLDKMEKDKVLTQKVVRKQDCITAVNRSHPAYTGFAGMPSTGSNGGNAGGASSSGSGGGGGGRGGSAGTGGGSKVSVSYCYRAPSSLRPVFGEEGMRDKERLYSEEEVAAALARYAAAQGLAEAGGIKLDRLLHGSLFNKKEPAAEGSLVAEAELKKRLLDRLQLHHRLLRPSEQGAVEVVRKGQVKPIVISQERRFGRNVTTVIHVESFALAADELSGVLQRKFQTSCSVSKLPGKDEKDHEIMMQGDLLKQVAAFLTETYGIPAALLELKQKGK